MFVKFGERSFVKMNDILNFIKIFQTPETTKVFTNGCCYWFAVILSKRFEQSTIMYNPVENHFATRIKDGLYDITGRLEFTCHYKYVNGVQEYDGHWIAWDSYSCYDSLNRERVYKQCILKIYD